MSYFEEIYQTCKVLAEHTGETELVPMLKSILAEIEALKQQVEQGKLDAVPEGWVAIPIIPTDKQIRAMEDQWMRGSNIDMAMREYRAAIAAAPKQEK